MKKYLVIRHIMFWAKDNIVTEGRLKIMYTDEAISRFLRDGYLEKIIDKEQNTESKGTTN